MTACHTRRELNLEDRCQNSLRCRYKQTKDKTATTPPPHPPRLTFNTLSWHSLERQRHFVVGCSLSGCYSVQWREKSKPAPETQEGLLVSWPALGTLRKSRRQRERHQTKGLMSITMAVHVHIKLCMFLAVPCTTATWNHAYFGERNWRRLIFNNSTLALYN